MDVGAQVIKLAMGQREGPQTHSLANFPHGPANSRGCAQRTQSVQ